MNLFLIVLCFANVNNYKIKIESKNGMLYDYKETNYEFDVCDFYVRLSSDFKNVKIKYQSKSYTKNFSLVCDSYVELLSIIKIDETIFWFVCESLGFEQFFILDLISDEIYEPFFDMKESVYVSKIDYNNQILFGDTWNSDKGIMPDQKVELYLFSTPKQAHCKIAEKYGEGFDITLLDNNIIQYIDSNKKIIQFDYSDWVKQDIIYTTSSFLIEGKTVYGANNLSSIDGLPWASENGFGINDIITIKTPTYSGMKLAIYNGFQSESRPDLYKANSRVKKVRIKNLESGSSRDFLLKDTPEMQEISLSNLILWHNVFTTLEITILDVYPGEKYKDLCIQAIIPSY